MPLDEDEKVFEDPHPLFRLRILAELDSDAILMVAFSITVQRVGSG